MDRFRRRDIFDDEFFKELEKEIRAMEERLSKMLEEQSRSPFMNLDPHSSFNKPLVYGFSMHIGENAEPEVNEFKNKKQDSEEDYLVDIFQEEDRIKVVAQVPAEKKEDIDLRIKDRHLVIKTKQGNYTKKVKLPCKVEAEESEAHYKNGVLQVILQKKEDSGEKIEIN